MKPGRFITFEGGEGCGKTTQIKLLSQLLTDNEIEHIITREPGGTPLAEKIRPLLVERHESAEEWEPLAELLLFLAARVQHWKQKIKPALQKGNWVLCDRFIDSTLVYQGIGKKQGIEYVRNLYHTVRLQEEWMPDLTILLDIDPAIGLQRAALRRDNETRFEELTLAFHESLRQGFLALALAEPKRFHIVDANQSINAIQLQIANIVLA